MTLSQPLLLFLSLSLSLSLSRMKDEG